MKHISVIFLLAASTAFADMPPDGITRFQSNQNGSSTEVRFADPSSWNYYDDSGWQPIDMDVVPWEIPAAATNMIRLKLDNLTMVSDTAIGSFDNPLNVRVEGLWHSTFNITNEFHITDQITQSGGGYSTVNIYNGANVSLKSFGELENLNIYGAGTTVTAKDGTDINRSASFRDGAVINIINGKKLRANGADANLVIDGATVNGGVETLNGGKMTFVNSTLNASRNNESITSGAKAEFTMDNSVYNNYYTGWDPADASSKWNGNVLFIGLGGGAEQVFTFKNKTVINGAGAADGTSYWDMDPLTRTRDSITNGGGFNLGWNSMSNDTDFLEVNVESGTKVAALNIVMGNNNVPTSMTGKITWNQSGTNATDGYTEVIIGHDLNMRASTVADSSFATEFNMKGFSSFEARDIYLGQDGMVSGMASLNMTGEGNRLVVKSIATSNQNSRDATMGGQLKFYSKGSNAANKNVIIIQNSEMIIQGSQAADSQFAVAFTLDGNTVLRGNDNKGVWLKLNEWGGKNYTTDVRFTVGGAGNDILLSGLEIGKNAGSTGRGIFEIVGGGSSIVLMNDGDMHNGFKLDAGGLLIFKADNTGLSSIVNYTFNASAFTGKLEVDLRGVTVAGDHRYELYVTGDMVLNERMSNWFSDMTDLNDLEVDEDFISVLLADPSAEYRFALETRYDDEWGGDVQALVVYFTAVPEPAFYAVLFAAGALLLALRRRKSN